MIGKKETVSIAWCDNGMVDGKFAEGLMTAVIAGGNFDAGTYSICSI
jgi:hypothetical protein